MKTKKFSSVENIIRKAKKGEMYILVDDEHRENEGDLVTVSYTHLTLPTTPYV